VFLLGRASSPVIACAAWLGTGAIFGVEIHDQQRGLGKTYGFFGVYFDCGQAGAREWELTKLSDDGILQYNQTSKKQLVAKPNFRVAKN
jgi:hypothetical protein